MNFKVQTVVFIEPLCQINNIRRCLPQQALVSLVISLVHTRLDYGCSTLVSLAANTISRLQSVLNAAARLVFSSRKTHRVSPPLQQLHWLKMDQRIEYSLLYSHRLHALAPPYLADELQLVSSLDTRRRLRSATTTARVIPPTRLSTVGDRAFPVVTARVRNSLQVSITSAATLSTLKQCLKSELFSFAATTCLFLMHANLLYRS